jgi:hypothetical protein
MRLRSIDRIPGTLRLGAGHSDKGLIGRRAVFITSSGRYHAYERLSTGQLLQDLTSDKGNQRGNPTAFPRVVSGFRGYKAPWAKLPYAIKASSDLVISPSCVRGRSRFSSKQVRLPARVLLLCEPNPPGRGIGSCGCVRTLRRLR